MGRQTRFISPHVAALSKNLPPYSDYRDRVTIVILFGKPSSFNLVEAPL